MLWFLRKYAETRIGAWTLGQQASGKRKALADKARRGMHNAWTGGSQGSSSAYEGTRGPADLRGRVTCATLPGLQG